MHVPLRAQQRLQIIGTHAQARQAGAKMLLIGGIQKMSTLVQWVKV